MLTLFFKEFKLFKKIKNKIEFITFIKMKNVKDNKKFGIYFNNGEKTFNKLSNIQTLIKKESTLKELCKFIYK